MPYTNRGVPHQEASTSRAAAEAISDLDTKLQQVYTVLKIYTKGLTDEEMQIALGMNPSTQRPRRISLVQEGLVRDSGTTRLTKSGRKAIVWETVV